jgi:hypothetical protein
VVGGSVTGLSGDAAGSLARVVGASIELDPGAAVSGPETAAVPSEGVGSESCVAVLVGASGAFASGVAGAELLPAALSTASLMTPSRLIDP